MKKSILFSAILLIICNFSNAQIAYHDAVSLKEYLQQSGPNLRFQALSGDRDGFIQILKKYVEPSQRDGINNSKDLYDYFNTSGNTFITKYINSGGSLSTSSDEKVATGVTNFGGAIGGLNVTNVADGLAKFLVERTKQELSITFFEKFKEVLNDSINKDFKTLFPKTYSTIEVIDKELYQFSHYLNTLREAFEKDLQNILTTLEPFLEAKKAKLYTDKPDDPVGQSIEYFESALLIVNNIRQGVHPAEAIGKLEYQTYHEKNKPLLHLQEGVKLFTIFSNSLRSTDSDSYWVDSNSLKTLFDLTTFNIYLGLLYQLHKNETINGKKFSTYLDEAENSTADIEAYKTYIKQLIVDSDKITLAIRDDKQKKENGVKVDSYKELFQSTLGFLKNFRNAENLNFGVDLSNSNKVWGMLDVLDDIYLDINERKYNALILDLSELFTELLGSDKFLWKDDLIKYGTFIANVAQAENSDEVKSAIEAVALPVGSASIKKRTKSNISLNAYVGLSPGLEYNGDLGKYKFSFGVNAPIGVAFSKGILDDGKEKGATTWFFSLIDLGAVTSFRFGDSETEELPEVKLENIFAPGLYYVYGLPKAPISFGLGGQLGPQLRGITSENLNLSSKLSYSFKFFIAVDIPLLNFYTKSR